MDTSWYLVKDILGSVSQSGLPTPIMFLDNLNQTIKSWRNPKFHVKISFFAEIISPAALWVNLKIAYLCFLRSIHNDIGLSHKKHRVPLGHP